MLGIHADEVYGFIGGGFSWTLMSYAAQTFPKPKNVYGLWILGLVQFGLANKTLAQDNFKTAQVLNQQVTKDG